MNKLEIQKRVLKDGNPLDLELFSWDEKTKTFASNESNLVIDFSNIHYTTINAWGSSTINAGYSSTINAGYSSTINSGGSSTINAWGSSTINAGYSSTINAGGSSTINAGCFSTINAGEKSVIVRSDVFEVIILENGGEIQFCPYSIKGYLTKEGDKWMKDGEEHVIIDGILSKVISHKGGVYKVVNHRGTTESYIVTNGIAYAHGSTIQEAKESLIFKISDRNVDEFKGLKLTDTVSLEQGIQMYRKITGSCESETKAFIKNLKEPKESYTIAEIIELTTGQFGNNDLKQFFNNKTIK